MAGVFDVAPVLEPPDAAPLLALGLYERIAAFDHVLRRAYIVSWGLPARGARRADRALARARELEGMLSAAEEAAHTVERGRGDINPIALIGEYEAMVAAVVTRVRAGDLYQANVSRRYEGKLGRNDHPYDLFQRLCKESPAPYCAYFRLEELAIVSNSPERFLSVTPQTEGLRASTRPIKGTRPRGATVETDAARICALQTSEKDRAENLMIVDLMRNDFSKVCAPGAVRVPALFGVETFANVHHLVSEVVGRLKTDKTAFDLFAAAFPPGSITGAPKIKAMEVIASLERRGRGVYCGSLGWFGLDGAMDASVLIRTAVCSAEGDDWRVAFNVGAGITADSDPAEEGEETIAKAASLKRAITGDVKTEDH